MSVPGQPALDQACAQCRSKVRSESLRALNSSWSIRRNAVRATGWAAAAKMVGARARALIAWNEHPQGRCHACRPREVHARSPAHAICLLTAAAHHALAGDGTWERVVKYRLGQALPSGVWHALGRLSTGCNLPRDAAACMSRARSCGVDLFYGAYYAQWKRSMFASLQSLSGPRRGVQSVGNSERSLQSPCGGGRDLAGGIIGEIMVAPEIFGF